MQRIRTACAIAGLMISGVALGQGNPLPSEVQASYARLKPNILKAADKMPAADYSFKPTADIRPFARVVNHVIEAQLHICGAANNTDSSALPKVPADTADKAVIVEALKASFASGESRRSWKCFSTERNCGSFSPIKVSLLCSR